MSDDTNVFCTAGSSHFMLYPNGDVYRCMADYNANNKPMFNALHDPLGFFDEPRACPHDMCYAGCDLDWAKKYAVQPDGTVECVYQPQDLRANKLNEETWPSPELGKRMRRFAHIVWTPSLVCNYSCTYCGCAAGRKNIGQEFPSSQPELTTQQWLTVWERIRKSLDYGVVTMSGGEPMLSQAVVPVFEMISPSFTLTITSNMSTKVLELSRGLFRASGTGHVEGFGDVPIGLQQITASLHPSSRSFSAERFKGAVLLLRNSGYKMVVNFVGYPTQLYLATEWKAWCEANDIKFIVSPWCGTDNDGHAASYTDAERAYLNSITPTQRQTGAQLVFRTYRHEMELPNSLSMHVGEPATLSGVVKNTGSRIWVGGGEESRALKVGARIRVDGTAQNTVELRAPINVDKLPPGAEYAFVLPLDTINIPPGRYRMMFDMVKEGDFWMEDKGATPRIVELEILE